ncbi:MAG: SCP2 sterol-binding domain-containing protein [Oscillospiraceae bacterium]|nr:SCP2 sterol-binding domain-containing protein [Oscillospiraceae bacterium]MBR1459358.1 SCP2 sterol-binding domain-containing protein [Oscillospiraceae bacterium]
MTYQELLKKVQTALAKADASSIDQHIAIQVDVTGEAAGAFYMEINKEDKVLYVEGYDYRDRDALLTADGADVLAVAQGKITLEAAIAEGKVAHEGNYDKTLALGSIIPAKKVAAKKTEAEAAEKPAKKAPAKKTAAKKAEAPAAAAEKPKRTRKPKTTK